MQFGNIKRNTHTNTQWDRAKFEVCAHKWADVSETGYGVAIMNDCKYGYGCNQNNLSLTLLKGAIWPNEMADKELHEFTYSIYPHNGDFKEANVAQEAYLLNQPILSYPLKKQDGKLLDNFSFVNSNNKNIMIETVKKCETDKSIIIRFYEYYNSRSKITFDFGFEFKKAFKCDMLENNIQEINGNGKKVDLYVNPFEIITLKLIY